MATSSGFPYSMAGNSVFNPSQENISSGPGAVGGSINPLMSWFGPPPQNPIQDATKNIWRTHEQYPAAYEGKSVFFGNVIMGLVAEANDALSSVIYPTEYTDELHFSWTTTTFNQTMVPEVPHEGVGRVLEYSKERAEAHSVRRGQAIKLEFDFFTTAQGKETFALQLTQLKNNIVRTNHLDILHSIRNCHAGPDAWRKQYGTYQINVNQQLQNEIDQFAIIPKDVDAKGMYKLLKTYKVHARRLGWEIDAILMRDNLMRWVNLNQIKSTAYMWRGPGGIEQMQKAANSVGSIQDISVYTVQDYVDIYGTSDLGPMQSYAQIGEYNTICGDTKSIWVYTEDDDDDQAEITREIAEAAFKKLAVDGSVLTTLLGELGITTGTGKLDDITKDNVDWLLVRPFMKYRCESMVFLKAGSSTGSLKVKPADVSFSQNGALKTMYVFVTYYSAAITHNEKQILIADNVHYDQYLGGCSNQFFDKSEIDQLKKVQYQFERLPMRNPVFKKSYIAWPIKLKSPPVTKKVIDITGFFTDQENTSTPDSAHYNTWSSFQSYFLTELMDRSPRGMAFQRRIPTVNTICCRGYQVSFDGTNKKVTTNSGHHGPMVYAGCGLVRQGRDYEYRQITYTQSLST